MIIPSRAILILLAYDNEGESDSKSSSLNVHDRIMRKRIKKLPRSHVLKKEET